MRSVPSSPAADDRVLLLLLLEGRGDATLERVRIARVGLVQEVREQRDTLRLDGL